MDGHFSYYAMRTPNVGPFRTSRSLSQSQSERRRSELVSSSCQTDSEVVPAPGLAQTGVPGEAAVQLKKFDNDSDPEPETERLIVVTGSVRG